MSDEIEIEPCLFGNVSPDGRPICQPVLEHTSTTVSGDSQVPVVVYRAGLCLEPKCPRSPAFRREPDQVKMMREGGEDVLERFSA